jgi:quinol monooxygenase YgiN
MISPGTIMTVLEAHVAEERAASLQEAWAAMQRPPQILQSFLVRSASDPTLWQGISIWRSREALEEYRRSVEVPGGIAMFRDARSEPRLSVYEVTVYDGA